jgi:hypothetical protein
MGLLQRFDPPAFLSDFDGVPGLREAWHTYIFQCFHWSISVQRAYVKGQDGAPGTVQFYNPAEFDPGGPLIEQPIIWNAFPKELLRCFGRTRALQEADRLWPRTAYDAPLPRSSPHGPPPYYRPQTEYCEWHVVRDPETQKIRRVTFTSEPPEYWQALAGDTVAADDQNKVVVKFPGDRKRLLKLYQELVSPEVRLEDIICQQDVTLPDGTVLFNKDEYNVLNKWNTTHGIAHLCAPPNAISAEVKLGADATILRIGANCKAVVDPQALICCSRYGGPDRNSDPTIGASVNALARRGALITLPNPVGLYMDHIDLSGWSGPKGLDIRSCVRIVRGSQNMIERMVVEVPEEAGCTVGDLTIGSAPIEYGGQIAECITIKLIGAAARLKSTANVSVPCVGRCCIDRNDPIVLDRAISIKKPTPVGIEPAFGEGQLVAANEEESRMESRPPVRFHGRAR